jgi:hypothetical protein
LEGVTLEDNGSLDSSTVTLNFASLNLNNTSGTLADNSSRLPSNVVINMNGAGFDLFGRAGSYSNESVGTVNLQSGVNVISSTDQSNIVTGPDSATLIIGNLTVATSAGATVDFAQNYQQNSAGALGLISDGIGHSENIFLTKVNGIVPTLTNNILGGWATVQSSYFNSNPLEFASYIPGTGVGALNAAGFAGYDSNSATFPTGFGNGSGNQNIRLTGTAQLPSGGATVNSFNLVNTTFQANITLNFANSGDVLVLNSGGLIVQNESTGSVATNTTVGAGTTLPFASTSGLAVGMFINGTNVTNGTTISAINGNVVTLSAATSGTVNNNTTYTFGSANFATSITQSGANTTLTFASTAALAAGMAVTGGSVPAGTTIVSVPTGTTVVISAPTTSVINSATSLTFGGGNTYVGGAPNSGQITSGLVNSGGGPNDLFLYVQNEASGQGAAFNSQVVDDNGAPVRLIINGNNFGLADSAITLYGTYG